MTPLKDWQTAGEYTFDDYARNAIHTTTIDNSNPMFTDVALRLAGAAGKIAYHIADRDRGEPLNTTVIVALLGDMLHKANALAIASGTTLDAIARWHNAYEYHRLQNGETINADEA